MGKFADRNSNSHICFAWICHAIFPLQKTPQQRSAVILWHRAFSVNVYVVSNVSNRSEILFDCCCYWRCVTKLKRGLSLWPRFPYLCPSEEAAVPMIAFA